MLEELSDDDIKITLDSLMLSDEGEPPAGITKEDYEAATMYHYDEKAERMLSNTSCQIKE